jgi:glycosyltransferase involved in cell wall biosynthesis
MLSHMYPSPVNPTAGIFVHEQVRALVHRGHDVRVVSPKGWAPPGLPRYRAYRRVPGFDRVDGVPVIYPRKLTLPGGRLGHRNADAMLWAIRRRLRRVHRHWPFEVIHAHMIVPDGWAAAALGAELGVATVATAHRADVLDLPRRGEAMRAVVGRAVDALDQVCTVSRRIARATEELGRPRRPVRVVPNGADDRVFLPRSAEEARVRVAVPPGEGPVLGYVGKLVPRKDPGALVEAMGILAARPGGAPRLLVGGVGELRPALEARARELGVHERIRFLGKIPHDDVAWVMSAADVVVLPSLSEGLPTVVCEAMACARPVVATAVDGTPEVVDDGVTGLLVAPQDPPALAAALARVLGDAGLRERMGRAALERSRAELTWAATARTMEGIYEEVVAAGGRPAPS